MTSKLFAFCVIGGLVAALGLAGLFSALSTQSSAQMMQHDGMMTQQSQVGYVGMHHGMFSAHGMSMVQDVRVSGVTITGDDDVSVNLNYVGNGAAPSVTVVAMTNHATMMGMMGGSSSMDGMMGSGNVGTNMPMMWNDPGMPMWNATQWRNWHSLVTAQSGWPSGQFTPVQSQTGSSLLDSGWQSGSTVTIKLDGVGVSAYNAPDLHICVFPHLT